MTSLAFKFDDDYMPAVFKSGRRHSTQSSIDAPSRDVSSKPSLFDRVKNVGRFLSDKKTDIAFIGANVAIGAAAKVLAASVLTASGGLAVAVGGAVFTGVVRVVVDHVKERRGVTILPEGERDWAHEARLLRQKIFSKEAAKKIAFGSAISVATFGTLDVLHHTDAGQHVTKWAGDKLSSIFNIQAPSFFKGWFTKPVGPSVRGAVHYSLLPNESVVDLKVPVGDAPVVPDVESAVPHPSSHHVHHAVQGAVLPEIAPVDDVPLPPLTEDAAVDGHPEMIGDKRVARLHEVVAAAAQDANTLPADLEALKNLQPEQVAKICDVDMPDSFGQVNDIHVDCETYKPDMDAGDVAVLKNIDEPDPKKGLRVLFAKAKEKTADFFTRAAMGDSGALPDMTQQAMADSVKSSVDTASGAVDVSSIAEPNLAGQVEEVLSESVSTPELTPQQMAQRVMTGGSFQYN